MNRLLAALLVVGVGAAVSAEPRQAAPSPSTAIQDKLWWLPPDTETLVVMQRAAPPMRGLVRDALLSEEIDVSDSPLVAAKPHLEGARVRFSIEGSRRFTAPPGLGEFPHEGVTIFSFMKPLGSGGRTLLGDLAKRGMRTRRVHGFDLVEFSEKVESTTWMHYIAVPTPDVLLDATNLDYLTEVLARIEKRPETRALPDDLREWHWVDTRSSFWALRHYRREHVQEDPTSPFRNDEASGSLDPGAIGITAHASADGRTIVTHYLSTNAAADRVATRVFSHPGDGVSPAVRRTAEEAIEVRFVAKDEDHLGMFVFYLFMALGRGTAL